MVLKKEPFIPYRTEEERAKDKSKVMTVRINNEDQDMIKQFQKIFDVKSEGTILKICMHNYWQVLHQGLSPRYLTYLFGKNRDRLSNYMDLKKLVEQKK